MPAFLDQISRRREAGFGVAVTLITASLTPFHLPPLLWALLGGLGAAILVRAALLRPPERRPEPSPAPASSSSTVSPTLISGAESTQVVVTGGIHIHHPHPTEPVPPEDP